MNELTEEKKALTVIGEEKVENKSINNSETKPKVDESSTNKADKPTESLEKNNVNEQEKSSENDEIKLKSLKKDFIYEVMSIPSHSSSEYRMLTYIVLWARRNGIDYEFDDYGNLYLTKGTLKENEFYPCVTAHLDTVQSKQKLYAQAGQELNIKTRVLKGKHEIYVDGMGIGGDDKAGVTIGLSMFSHFDTLKACFFLEEEIGCKGSEHMNVKWFENVGYVIGYDSPDLNRAAWACSGVKLFDKEFFKTHMQEICKKHGLTDFRSEPFTDVKIIREKTDIICMNFGTGYYNAHMPNEYCVLEDMDVACGMGIELIQHLGNKRYELKAKKASSRIWTGASYSYSHDEDEAYFDSLNPNRYSSAYGYAPDYNKSSYSGSSYSANSSSAAKTTKEKKDEKETIDYETFVYTVETYENYIENVKKSIEAKCKELKVDYSVFDEIFKNNIKL